MTSERDKTPSEFEWTVQLGEGALSPAQKKALSDWLLDSPHHVRSLLESMLLDHDLHSLPISAEQMNEWVQAARSAPADAIPLTPSTGLPADDVQRRESSMTAQDARPAKPRLSWMRWSIAASVVVAVMAALGYGDWQAGRYATDFGEQRVITLADGSVVSLNTESALKVDLSSSRRVITLLKGEAFFRVAHDPSRPFEVLARKATVKAVGTQFNVRMTPQATVVSVLDGTVEIREPAPMGAAGASPGAASAVRIRKGEETLIPLPDRLAERALIARTTTRAAQRAAAWTQGRVDFDATPLIDVIAEFQRYQIVSVQIDDRASQELKLTGSFDVHDPDSALAYVATIPGMVVEKQGEHAFRIRHTL
jgi:transmembrane sensor